MPPDLCGCGGKHTLAEMEGMSYSKKVWTHSNMFETLH